MSDISFALLMGILVGAVIAGVPLVAWFAVSCHQCRKEHEHEVRIHDAE